MADDDEENGQEENQYIQNEQNPIGHVEQVNNFELGVQHLTSLDEPLLRNVINQNLPLLLFDNQQQMTVFEDLTKALVEEGARKDSRPTIYLMLVTECNFHVNPAAVAGLDHADLIGWGVGGQLKAEAIRQFALSFEDPNELDQLTQLNSEALFGRLKSIPGIGGYRALYMLVFGMRRFDYMPLPELTLRKKLHRLYGN